VIVEEIVEEQTCSGDFPPTIVEATDEEHASSVDRQLTTVRASS
jgi:hypothetical protein